MTIGPRDSASGNDRASEATASTLNYVLGRRHLKSWMTTPVNDSTAVSAGPSKNSVPSVVGERAKLKKRIPPDSSNRQHTTQAATPINAPSAERLPPSNSTSPQLPNAITTHQRNTSHGDANATVLPSPTPSEEKTHTEVVQDNRARKLPAVEIDSFDFRRLQSPTMPVTTQGATSLDLENQNGSAPKRPAEGDPAPVEKRARTHAAPQEPLLSGTSSSAASPVQQLSQYPEFPRRPSAAYAQHASPLLDQAPNRSSLDQQPREQMASPQLGQIAQQHGPPSIIGGNPSPVQGHHIQGPSQSQTHASPSLSTHASPSLSTHTFGALPDAQQTVQQQTAQSHTHASHRNDWYSREMCTYRLNSFKASHLITAAQYRDRERLQVLEEAVNIQDWSYLTMHQNYCLLTHSPNSLPPSLRRTGQIAAAFRLMRDVLDNNLHLSPPTLDFFSKFPLPIHEIVKTWPVLAQHAENEFLMFVEYSSAVESLRFVCENRKFPPTPREFADCKITSITFQHLLLRSIIRTLWAKYPPVSAKRLFEDRVVQAWDQEFIAFQRHRTQRFGIREQAEDEMRYWNFTFTQYTTSFEAALQSSGLQRTAPALPPTQPQRQFHLQSQPQPQQPQPQPQPQPYQPQPYQPQSHQPQSHQPQPHQPQQHQPRPYQPQPHQPQLQQPPSQPQQPQQPRHAVNTSVTEDTAMSRHRQQPSAQVLRRPTVSQVSLPSRSGQKATPLLPRPGLLQPQQRVPNPSRFSLHQAHLRSPVLQVSNLSSPAYYFWQGFVCKPQRLVNPNKAIEKLSFFFSEKEMSFVAKAASTAPGAPDRRMVAENDKLIRLRCVKWVSEEKPNDNTWAIAENSWIPHSYFTFNGSALQLRKKLHNGKDLPVNLTGLVQKGTNVLEISTMSNFNDTTHQKYLIAIEFLGIMTQASIKERCHRNRIPAEKTIGDIKRKMSISNDDDDDIAIVESMLTINVRDPISASQICGTPVRSIACLHNECFDLDIFLETRPRKGDVSAADQWRCPICNADARPNMLVADDFLVQVREELTKQGLLETRAIIVDQDGSWKPKTEERDPNGVQSRDIPKSSTTPTAMKPKPPVVHEIIDIDSD